MLCLLAILLVDKLDTKVDLLRLLKILIVHDLGESITGDVPASEISTRRDNKYEAEKQAMVELIRDLPRENAEEILALWEEYAAKETLEAQVAVSLDKLEAVLQHNVADISTWDQGDFNIHPYYRNECFDFDSFMRSLKDIVDRQSMEKIVSAHAEDRIDPAHIEQYKRSLHFTDSR